MARKAVHRDNIVRTAMRLFRRQGFAATGLQQIIAESGAPRGSLYHYFPDGKDELAVAALELAAAMVATMLEDCLARTRSASGFVSAVTDQYAEWMVEGEFASGCPIATITLECAPHNPAITEAGERAFDRWITIAQGAFARSGSNARQARQDAEAFFAALEGALILARVRRSDKPLRSVARSFEIR